MANSGPHKPITIAKPSHSSRPGGVLPVPNTDKTKVTTTQNSHKEPEPRLKVVVRRLPPGLIEDEFFEAVGDEWKVGKGKADWVSYQKGKISKDPSKPSRPSRSYLHLTNEQHLTELSEKVRHVSIIDAKGTFNDPVLIGPPIVEFSPWSKIPNSKSRKDGRQGTIDQDPEFIDFLTSLTNPITKLSNIDAVSDKNTTTGDTKSITPLVQYLKDKKANKIKETQTKASKGHGRQESKDGKNVQEDKKNSKSTEEKSNSKKKNATPAKAEKISKETAKAQKQATAAKSSTSGGETTTQPSSPAGSKPERKRERGSASAAAKILQRDLGLGGNQSRRKRETTSNTSSQPSQAIPADPNSSTEVSNASQTPTTTTTTTTTTPATTSGSTTKASIQAPTGPAATRKSANQNTSTPATNSNSNTKSSQPSTTPTATQAFLKHANPSQGVTEPLLEEAFKVFGTITKVEIDKKKGFAYIDFVEAEGLQKAIAASPVKVAQGQVVVLERKTGASLQNRNARNANANANANATSSSSSTGGGGGGGGGGQGSSNSTAGNTTTSSSNSTNANNNTPNTRSGRSGRNRGARGTSSKNSTATTTVQNNPPPAPAQNNPAST
jgi:regulator of nonsense transcripts 3